MRVAKSNKLRILLRIQDAVLSALVFALVVDVLWYLDQLTHDDAISHLRALGLVLVFSVAASWCYSPKLHRQTLVDFIQFCARYSLIVVLCLVLTAFFSGMNWLSNEVVFAYFVMLTIGLAGNRMILQWWYLQGHSGLGEHRANHLKVLVIGTGPRAQRFIEAYKSQVEWQVDIVEMIDPMQQPGVRGSEFESSVAFDNIQKLLALEVVDEVVVCVPRSLLDRIGPVVDACEEQGICLKFMADLYEMPIDNLTLERVGDIPVMSMDFVTINMAQQALKRSMDLTVSIIALLLLLPVFLVVAVAIKIGSPGKVFFVQSRIGLNKRPFKMIKFRSMCEHADKKLKAIEHLNEAQGPVFKITEDPRVTRLGRFLRRRSIDELPQLLNVVMGHMSLIGPRPLTVRDVSLFDRGRQHRRFSVRPGLGCLREVSGRSSISFDRWLELDLEYIDRWSFALDFKIMFRMVKVVLSGQGAV